MIGTKPPIPPNSSYNGEERRTENPHVREEIGENKILNETQRQSVIERLKNGLFGRKNKALRQALGEEKILKDEERQTVLAIITQAISKFVKAGVRYAREEEKRKSFVEMVRHRQQMQEKEREQRKRR